MNTLSTVWSGTPFLISGVATPLQTVSITPGSLLLLCIAIMVGIIFGIFIAGILLMGDNPQKREAKEQNNRIEERLTRSMVAHERIADFLEHLITSRLRDKVSIQSNVVPNDTAYPAHVQKALMRIRAHGPTLMFDKSGSFLRPYDHAIHCFIPPIIFIRNDGQTVGATYETAKETFKHMSMGPNAYHLTHFVTKTHLQQMPVTEISEFENFINAQS